MLTEWLMEHYGWRDVWYLGSNGLRRGLFKFLGPDSCLVGIWTGPDLDLLCVRRCETREDAEGCLSPPGWTILHATIKAWIKRLSVDAHTPSFSHEDTDSASCGMEASKEDDDEPAFCRHCGAELREGDVVFMDKEEGES